MPCLPLRRAMVVEVKSNLGALGAVSLTPTEHQAAQEHSDSYVLALVEHMDSVSPRLRMIQNPVAALEIEERMSASYGCADGLNSTSASSAHAITRRERYCTSDTRPRRWRAPNHRSYLARPAPAAISLSTAQQGGNPSLLRQPCGRALWQAGIRAAPAQ